MIFTTSTSAIRPGAKKHGIVHVSALCVCVIFVSVSVCFNHLRRSTTDKNVLRSNNNNNNFSRRQPMRNDNVIEPRKQVHTSQQNKYYVFCVRAERRRSYENVLRVYSCHRRYFSLSLALK